MRSDKEVVQAVLDGDVQLFSELVCKYANALYSIAYSLIGDFHAAQDIAQEAFIKAYNNLAKLNDYDKTGNWLYTITRRLSLDWLRKYRTPEVQLEEVYTLSHARSLEEQIEQRMTREEVWGALNKLDEHNRVTVVLFYISGYSMKETATILNVSEKAVESRLRRSRHLLKNWLSHHQVGPFLQQQKMDNWFAQQVMKQLLQRLGGVYIPVSCRNRSVEWFVRQFGLALSDNGNPQLPSGETLYFLETKTGKQSECDDGLPLLSFATEQIVKLHSRLKHNGVAVGEIKKEAGGTSFSFYDPDWNKFVVCEEN